MDIYTILSSKPHNDHYLKRYVKFIESCKQANNLCGVYTEGYHICPKRQICFWNINLLHYILGI